MPKEDLYHELVARGLATELPWTEEAIDAPHPFLLLTSSPTHVGPLLFLHVRDASKVIGTVYPETLRGVAARGEAAAKAEQEARARHARELAARGQALPPQPEGKDRDRKAGRRHRKRIQGEAMIAYFEQPSPLLADGEALPPSPPAVMESKGAAPHTPESKPNVKSEVKPVRTPQSQPHTPARAPGTPAHDVRMQSRTPVARTPESRGRTPETRTPDTRQRTPEFHTPESLLFGEPHVPRAPAAAAAGVPTPPPAFPRSLPPPPRTPTPTRLVAGKVVPSVPVVPAARRPRPRPAPGPGAVGSTEQRPIAMPMPPTPPGASGAAAVTVDVPLVLGIPAASRSTPLLSPESPVYGHGHVVVSGSSVSVESSGSSSFAGEEWEPEAEVPEPAVAIDGVRGFDARRGSRQPPASTSGQTSRRPSVGSVTSRAGSAESSSAHTVRGLSLTRSSTAASVGGMSPSTPPADGDADAEADAEADEQLAEQLNDYIDYYRNPYPPSPVPAPQPAPPQTRTTQGYCVVSTPPPQPSPASRQTRYAYSSKPVKPVRPASMRAHVQARPMAAPARPAPPPPEGLEYPPATTASAHENRTPTHSAPATPVTHSPTQMVHRSAPPTGKAMQPQAQAQAVNKSTRARAPGPPLSVSTARPPTRDASGQSAHSAVRPPAIPSSGPGSPPTETTYPAPASSSGSSRSPGSPPCGVRTPHAPISHRDGVCIHYISSLDPRGPFESRTHQEVYDEISEVIRECFGSTGDLRAFERKRRWWHLYRGE